MSDLRCLAREEFLLTVLHLAVYDRQAVWPP